MFRTLKENTFLESNVWKAKWHSTANPMEKRENVFGMTIT